MTTAGRYAIIKTVKHSKHRTKNKGVKNQVLMSFEEVAKDWAAKGYKAVKASEAAAADKNDTKKVIIYWA